MSDSIVRINCMREQFGVEDVQAILAIDTPPPALMMPKVRTPDEVVMLDNLLSERGHDTRLHIIIETNAAWRAIKSSLRAAKKIGCEPFWDEILARPREVEALTCSWREHSRSGSGR